MNLDIITKQVTELTAEVGEYILKSRDEFKIEVKGKQDFVTTVDKNSEEKIVAALKKILPNSGFIAEEGTGSGADKQYKWIIDPIDGTTNFIHGSPPFSISIALADGDKLILGVVYEITMKECFHSHIEEKAYLNNTEIRVSGIDKVSNSLIATGFPYNNFDRLKPFMHSLEYFFCNTNGVRRLGSAAADLAYVACGRYDGFYEYNLKPWDVAAGAFLVQQAGGKVSDFRDGNEYIFGKEIVAANSNIFDEFRAIVGDFMNP